MKGLAVTLLTLLLTACSADKAADQIYRAYNDRVIAGMSFDDEMAYYSQRKQAKIEAKFPDYMQRMNKTREQVIEFYLDFTRELAKGKEIQLVRETITGNNAELEYAQKDICDNASDTEKKQLVNEAGWKIDEVAISL